MNDSLKLIFFILGRKMVHDPNGLAMGWQKGAPAYKKLHGILKSQHKIVLDTKREIIIGGFPLGCHVIIPNEHHHFKLL